VLRLGAAQKRNVTYQATVIPYTRNSITGPAARRSVFVLKEPTSKITNSLGESKDLESHDGGEMILLLHRLLENRSMPGYSNPIHHKSIISGRTMTADGEFRESILFKYASYSVGNGRLRKSPQYRNMIEFALTQPLLFAERIDFTKDYNGNTINYRDFNITIETPTGYKKLTKLEKVGVNNYNVSFIDYNITTD